MYTDIQPVLTVLWVDEAMHRAGVEALLGSGRRGPSLVDCVSFVAMRQEGTVDALALDAHFAAQGFRCHPGVSVEQPKDVRDEIGGGSQGTTG